MKLSKRIFALILSMVMLLSAASITAFGEYAITPDADDKLEEDHVCSYNISKKADATYHWDQCTCGYYTAKVAHSYAGGVVTSHATLTNDGVITGFCVCGATTSVGTISKKQWVRPLLFVLKNETFAANMSKLSLFKNKGLIFL